jgi:VIT1/CCC1 family predicted Fe2+/Mn2+ transporter
MTEAVPEPFEGDEGHAGEIASRLNWLRAGVMGANDGIVSTAGMVLGVAGAAVSDQALLAAGIAAVPARGARA